MAYSQEWYEKNKESIKAAKKRYYERTKQLKGRPQKEKTPIDPRMRMFYAAKDRSKKSGIEFDITVDDIIIPDVCPVLGIEIKKSEDRHACPNSPSLDRRDSTKGYVKGNVFVISWRANKLKGDATPEELALILKYAQETS